MRGGRRSKGPVPRRLISTKAPSLRALPRLQDLAWTMGSDNLLLVRSRRQRPTQRQQSNLGLWGRGSSNRDGSSRQPPQGLPQHEPALRMCLSEWSSQSRHSSLHLLGAHPPVDAVTAGRQGRDLRQTQTRLAPSSVVGTPAGQTIRLGNGPAACVPVLRLVDFLSMPKSDRGEDKTWTIARD